MPSERYLEILIARAPEQIFGAGFAVAAQQLTLPSGRVDLLLSGPKDTRHLVEVKKAAAKREAVDQVLAYLADFKAAHRGNVRAWIVANEIPDGVRDYAASNGVETKAIPEAFYGAIIERSGLSESDLLGKRVLAGVIMGGGVQRFPKNSVPLHLAVAELPDDVARLLNDLLSYSDFAAESGKMQIALSYKGVKIGGINRGHRHIFISGNVALDQKDASILLGAGFARTTKTQASSSHTHVYWKCGFSRCVSAHAVFVHFSKSIDARVFGQQT